MLMLVQCSSTDPKQFEYIEKIVFMINGAYSIVLRVEAGFWGCLVGCL
jgi:hypothetical protein